MSNFEKPKKLLEKNLMFFWTPVWADHKLQFIDYLDFN